jgi:RimJ/RimL family protein N-acetyltransferase
MTFALCRSYPRNTRLTVAETERLLVRWLNAGDSAFILELVNDPSWIRFIGEKGVKTPQDALRYIEDGPVAMYKRTGFGLYMVELRESGEPIGICGLIKREGLKDVDLGFAFLPRFWRNGYAFESASAVMRYGRKVLRLGRIVAILSQDNHRSSKLLEKLGFCFESTVKLRPDDEELKLYAIAP